MRVYWVAWVLFGDPNPRLAPAVLHSPRSCFLVVLGPLSRAGWWLLWAGLQLRWAHPLLCLEPPGAGTQLAALAAVVKPAGLDHGSCYARLMERPVCLRAPSLSSSLWPVDCCQGLASRSV